MILIQLGIRVHQCHPYHRIWLIDMGRTASISSTARRKSAAAVARNSPERFSTSAKGSMLSPLFEVQSTARTLSSRSLKTGVDSIIEEVI